MLQMIWQKKVLKKLIQLSGNAIVTLTYSVFFILDFHCVFSFVSKFFYILLIVKSSID